MKFLEFTTNNCRTHEADSEKQIVAMREAHPEWLEDPDLRGVRGIAPHFWKRPKEGRKVSAMNQIEQWDRLADHQTNGVDNGYSSWRENKSVTLVKPSKPINAAIPILIGAFISAAAMAILLFHHYGRI